MESRSGSTVMKNGIIFGIEESASAQQALAHDRKYSDVIFDQVSKP